MSAPNMGIDAIRNLKLNSLKSIISYGVVEGGEARQNKRPEIYSCGILLLRPLSIREVYTHPLSVFYLYNGI